MKQLYKDYQFLLNLSLKEDLLLKNKSISCHKDITTDTFLSCSKKKINVKAEFIAKEKMVVCGITFLKYLAKNDLKDFKCNFFVKEGEIVTKGKILISWQGAIEKILIYERSVLNIFQYLCGIANQTKKIVELVKKINPHIQVLDTRKILPGFRHLAKYAVKIGGGKNHRTGLYDMFLIKDNHWELLKKNNLSMKQVISKMKKSNKKIEIECATKNQVFFLLERKISVNIILFDNMKINTIQQCIQLIKEYNLKEKKKIKIEVSGNLDEKKIAKMKGLSIDYVSLGKLTHSVVSSDISLNIT